MLTIVQLDHENNSRGFFVACRRMNNFITGSSGFLGRNLISQLPSTNNIPHERIDVTDFSAFPIDNFYFLSSYGNMWGQDDMLETVKANVLDLVHVLSGVANKKLNSFVYISSSSVKLDYQTPYSRTKRAAEEILLSYMEKFKLPICIIRPFSITGVGEQKEHLIPKLINSCFTGELLNFVPYATHDFIDVQDVVKAIIQLSKKSVHGIFEVGCGKQYSNQQVLELVEEVTKRKANVNHVESMRPYDSKDWFSTNYKVRSWGWLPETTLKDSIKQMVKAYEKQR